MIEEETLRKLPISTVRPDPQQPRKHFAGLEELAESIRMDGLIEPIMVRPVKDGYVIVHGERRFRASQLAGLQDINAIVRELTEAEAYRISAIENIQRNNLTAIEEARVYQRFIDTGLTQSDVGTVFGKTQGAISHTLTLLGLNPGLMWFIESDALKEAHIRQIMRLKGIYGAALQRDLCEWRGDCKAPEAFTRSIKEYGLLAPIGVSKEAVPDLWSQVIKLRPLEGWACTTEPCQAVTAAYERFRHYVSRHKFVLPQWEVAGFWFACQAAQSGLSVVALMTIIDAFKERYESYLWWWNMHGGFDKSPHDKREAARYWAYYGDLRHSGSIDEKTGLLKAETRFSDEKEQRKIMEHNLKMNCFVLPTGLRSIEVNYKQFAVPEHIAELYDKEEHTADEIEALHSWGLQ